ncbi:MAG: peptidoglycan-binding domain-containing protein [Microcoleaceae cyanobacterium]
MMDSYAYLHLSLNHNSAVQGEEKVRVAVDWKMLSSQAFQGFLSIAVVLTVFNSIAQSADALVQQGSVGSEVRAVQQALQARGYFSANITGYFGPLTTDAILRFQRDAGLQQDGIAGPRTLVALGLVISNPSNPTVPARDLVGLGVGDRGPGVSDLQGRLRQFGYFTANPTGYFGQITRDAVVRFQRANRLQATGLVTEETLAALNFRSVSQFPSPRPIPTVGLTVLKFGDFGGEVGVLQQQLQRLGYYSGLINNYFDADTEFAVIRFQRDYRIQPTGQVGTTTQALLSRSTTVITTRPVTLPARPPVTTLPARPPIQVNPLNNNVLSLGDQGVAVGVLQQRLQALGYYTGSVSNIYDLTTRRAVMSFQRDYGITQTGQVGVTTQTHLVRAVPPLQSVSTPRNALSLGSAGEDVRQLQQQLRASNYYSGPITGFYDRATQVAVVRFQRAQGITATGVTGPTTRTYLSSAQFTPTPISAVSSNSLSLSSQSIQDIQERLRTQGLYYGPIDGEYNERTQQAIARARDLYGVSAETILFGGL